MTTVNRQRPMLDGCAVLPTMEPPEPIFRQPNKPRRPKRQTGDRFAVLNGFVDCSMARLSRSELATWLVLYRDTRNGTAVTAQADVARRIGLSIRGVQKAMNKLRKWGLLIVLYQGGLNRGTSRYRVEPLTNRGS